MWRSFETIRGKSLDKIWSLLGGSGGRRTWGPGAWKGAASWATWAVAIGLLFQPPGWGVPAGTHPPPRPKTGVKKNAKASPEFFGLLPDPKGPGVGAEPSPPPPEGVTGLKKKPVCGLGVTLPNTISPPEDEKKILPLPIASKLGRNPLSVRSKVRKERRAKPLEGVGPFPKGDWGRGHNDRRRRNEKRTRENRIVFTKRCTGSRGRIRIQYQRGESGLRQAKQPIGWKRGMCLRGVGQRREIWCRFSQQKKSGFGFFRKMRNSASPHRLPWGTDEPPPPHRPTRGWEEEDRQRKRGNPVLWNRLLLLWS